MQSTLRPHYGSALVAAIFRKAALAAEGPRAGNSTVRKEPGQFRRQTYACRQAKKVFEPV
jgi:hypothetical protein